MGHITLTGHTENHCYVSLSFGEMAVKTEGIAIVPLHFVGAN